MEGHRKGRTKPAELEGTSGREDNGFIQTDISDLIPTPTTQEIEHPEAQLTPNNRRLSKDEEQSQSELSRQQEDVENTNNS